MIASIPPGVSTFDAVIDAMTEDAQRIEAMRLQGDLDNSRDKAAKRAALDYVRNMDEQIAAEIRSEWRAS